MQAASSGSWSYLPWRSNIQVLGHFSAWWAHAFFERHHPLHEAIRLFEDVAGNYGSDEKLGLAALDLHRFPEFGKGESGGGVGRIDGASLGLVEDDHGQIGRWSR